MNDCYINHVRLQGMIPFSSATNMSRGPTLPMLIGPSHKPIEYTTSHPNSLRDFQPPCYPARFLRLRGLACRADAGKRQVEAGYLKPVIVHDARKRVNAFRFNVEHATTARALRVEMVIATEIVTVGRIGHGDTQHFPAFRKHP